MYDLILTDNQFNPNGYWTEPIGKLLFSPTPEDLDLFDQNGYDLNKIKKHSTLQKLTLKPCSFLHVRYKK